MSNAIHITELFPKSRERTILLELLKTVHILQEKSIEVIICGGWVPFLKDLALRSSSDHCMSLDIDLVLPERSRTRETVDRLKQILLNDLEFHISKNTSSKLEKHVGSDLIELDLLADVPRGRDGSGVVRIYGEATSLDLALLDGGVNLAPHVEQITITHQDDSGDIRATSINIPNAVGFLMLKAEVTKFRQEEKDPYDIYYYCTHCERVEDIRLQLQNAIGSPGVRETIDRLHYMFHYPDSDWVLRILDHAKVQGSEREREAQRIVRTMNKIIEGL